MEGSAARGIVASSAAIVLATAGIVLAPYATTTLAHRQALVVQATTILMLTAAALVVGVARTGWRERLVAVPRGVQIGVVLYGATALVATLVALVRGNEPALIAGQLLSMGLLPLGAAAAAVNASPQRAAVFAWSLAGSAAVAAIAHFVHWGWMLREGQQVMRLFMGNSVSVGGVSLLALLLAIALAAGTRAGHRRVACLMAALIAVFIVGSGTRSLWLASAVGLAVALVLLRFWRLLQSRKARRTVVAAGSILFLVIAAVVAWWHWPRENLLPDADTLAPPFWRYERGTTVAVDATPRGERFALSWDVASRPTTFAVSNRIWLEGGRLYRFRGALRTNGSGQGRLGVAYVGGSRTVCQWQVARAPGTREWTEVEVPIPVEGDVMMYLVAGTDPGADGAWWAADLRLEDLGPSALATVARQFEYLASRTRTTLDVLEGGPKRGDENVAFRVLESITLAREFRSSAAIQKIFGHGLGARFQLGAWAWGTLGNRLSMDAPNYIHNFYAFLLFKTGIIGAAAVLAALVLWLRALLRAAREPDQEIRGKLAGAAFAALAAYMLWSLACPEILDFRVAPLWGFVVVALTQRPGAGTAA